jgi:hypothetical protein
MEYKIIGSQKVANHEPGETISDDDLAGANIEALVAAGHLRPKTTRKAKEAEEQN